MRLLKRPTYTAALIGMGVDSFFVGNWIFMPKYMEVHFGLSAWWANIFGGEFSKAWKPWTHDQKSRTFVGTLPALTGVISCYLSGFLVAKDLEFRKKAPSRLEELFLNATLVCLFSFICLALVIIPLFLSCPQVPLADVDNVWVHKTPVHDRCPTDDY